MSENLSTTLLLASCAAGLVVLIRLLGNRGWKHIGLASHRVNLPGPYALPFLGNVLEVLCAYVRHDRPSTNQSDL